MMEKRVDLKKVLFSIILIIGFFSLTDAYGAISPKIASGYYHTVALKKELSTPIIRIPPRSLWAWGNNDYGQVRDGTVP
jgi:alpha-tubulin suppressor-like RCC1 family protein